jgi:hypothetical protein
MTGKIWLKSPPNKIVFPLNGKLWWQLTQLERASRNELSNVSKQHLLFIGASSHTIIDVISRRREMCVCFL